MATDLPVTARRKAYSYLRFSTPEQSKGDSQGRQQRMAHAYALKHGLDLDGSLTFHDLGISAFRGQNAEAGRLAYFLEAVHTGLVPQGSVLLVEQLDRLSRLVPRRAVRVLEDIVDAGVSVVTLNDEREYTPHSMDRDPLDLLIAVVTFMRANEESATKSKRLSQAWGEKRRAIGDGKPLTGIAPAWVNVNVKAGTIELVPERADLVRRIYAMALDGVGKHGIAVIFNREGIPTWGRAAFWGRSYIAKILENPSVVGTLIPHIMDYSDGAKPQRVRTPQVPIEGYYPQVISPKTFADVQALGVSKRAPGQGARAGAPLSNVLAGMAKCPLCSGTMTRVAKGARSRPSLVCVKAKDGAGCRYRSVPLHHIENAILERLWEHLADIPSGGDDDDATAQAIANLDERRDDLRGEAGILLDNLSYQRSAALVARLVRVEADIDEATAGLNRLWDVRDATSGPLIGARVARALALLRPDMVEGASPAETIDRAALNAALRGIFTEAVINYPNGSIDFRWTHGGLTELQYAMAS
jgi:DNA invertase Pin-like site-specific DNA recombinase